MRRGISTCNAKIAAVVAQLLGSNAREPSWCLHIRLWRMQSRVKPKAIRVEEADLVRRGYLSPDAPFPLVFEPNREGIAAAEWAAGHRGLIEEELARHGALLFRGFFRFSKYNAASKKFVRWILTQGELRCETRDHDRYGRTVAECWAGDMSIGDAMVRSGWAWALPRYSKERFLPAQEEAERAGLGVWAGHANCEAPARFRREHR